ncbi:MAG TPA: CUAEP/CCAEP-tail radical SAM protein [Polyangia bacterium]|nr:CUAEP/CCAEP-tail radical SAM protein [Polyangia bacterium]
MARVLLISTYELGHQPLHLASPLGFLAAAGIDARAVDLAVERLDEEAVRAASFVGVAVPMHTALRLGAEAGARVKALHACAHLCYYGLYAPLNREYLLAHGADSIVGGEYEAALVELVRGALGDGAPAAATPDVTLDRLKFAAPARASLPALDKYARLETASGARLAGYVEASRGCLHHCRHCPIPPVYGGRFFVVPVDVVLADVSAQVAAGARHVTLGDPDFLNGPKHALAVARAIHAAHPDVTFDVTIKVEHILKHRELFAELGALGCAFVVSAVESLSERVLAILDKGHTRADVDEALAILDGAGVPLRPTFVPFTPWTTMDDYLALVDWLAAHGMVDHVDPIQLAIRLLIPPGSLLLDHPETRPHLGALEPEKLSYAWTHPDPRMDRLAHDVFAAVEGGATFADVRALAEAAAARPPTREPIVHKTVRGRPPRLSESWFC